MERALLRRFAVKLRKVHILELTAGDPQPSLSLRGDGMAKIIRGCARAGGLL